MYTPVSVHLVLLVLYLIFKQLKDYEAYLKMLHCCG
jgi:hypothetical protein